MGKLAKAMSGQIQPGAKPFKSGGKVKHDDEAQDRVLISKMIKQESKVEKKGMKKGGKCAK